MFSFHSGACVACHDDPRKPGGMSVREAIAHLHAIEAEMVPQEGCCVGVAAELMVRQELAALIALGRRNDGATDFNEAGATRLGELEIRQRPLAHAARSRRLGQLRRRRSRGHRRSLSRC